MIERTHVDLFSGIGGFALAAAANGVRTIQFVEIDERCRDFLAKAWPGVPIWDDVRTFGLVHPDATAGRSQKQERGQEGRASVGWASPVYLLTAGVPCQPASRAGRQRGKEDHRWLWPETIRVIAAIKPRWALLENPPGIGDVGLAGILSALEAQGYEVRVVSIPACAVGAPHRRERFWFVAHFQGKRRETLAPERVPRNESASFRKAMGNSPEHESKSSAGQWSNYVWLPCADGKVRRAPSDTQRMAHGLPVELLEELEQEDAPRLERFMQGQDGEAYYQQFEPSRTLLGALGNSIVWPVAAEIIKAMKGADELEA